MIGHPPISPLFPPPPLSRSRRGGPADQAGIRLHGSKGEAAAGENALIGVIHFLVAELGAFLVPVEAVGVLHDELASPHEAEARTNFIPELGLDLITIQRELPIGTDVPTNQVCDHFLMRRTETEVALMTILDPEQLLPVKIPTTGFPPKFARRRDRHEQFLASSPPHPLSNNTFDLSIPAEPDRELGEASRPDLAD